jgi:deoxyribonuclease-4
MAQVKRNSKKSASLASEAQSGGAGSPGLEDLGAHTFGLVWQLDVVESIEKLGAHGFRLFQLLASPPHLPQLNPHSALANRIRRAVANVGGSILSLDLPVSEINIASPIPEVVAFSVDHYRKAIDFAAAVESRHITVTSGRKHALLPPPAGEMDGIFEDAFHRVAVYAQRAGLRVLFENHPQGFRPDVGSMMELIARPGLDHVDLLYDVANGFAIGEDPVAGLHAAATRLGGVHFSDAPSGAWRHDPIGTGDIDFASILCALDEIGFTGPCVAEIISDSPLQHLLQARERLCGTRRRSDAACHVEISLGQGV